MIYDIVDIIDCFFLVFFSHLLPGIPKSVTSPALWRTGSMEDVLALWKFHDLGNQISHQHVAYQLPSIRNTKDHHSWVNKHP